MIRKLKHILRAWWECNVSKRCAYYDHYLAYGAADLTHIGFHAAERKAEAHFKSCSYNGEGLCRVCSNWERRVRA